MMSLALLSRQIPVDEWVLLPTKLPYWSTEEKKKRWAHARFVRHLLFDIGKGKFQNLSPEQHKIVLAACRQTYAKHVENCKRDGRTPMPFRGARDGFVNWWKYFMKGRYVRYDVPNRVQKYQDAA